MSRIGIGITTNADKKVVIEYSEKVDHLEFTPQEAGEYARQIILKAQQANGKNGTNLILPAELH